MLWVVLCVFLPPTLSESIVKSSCHIQPVEVGDNATLTVIFGEDLSWETSIAFSVYHLSQNSLTELQMLSCHFSSGHVECEHQNCCTPDEKVTNVFRVVIHNVSQEHEGRFWGFVNPSDMSIQRSCNFTLRASTCSIDDITAENNHVNCTVQPVTIGHSCIVTCDKSYILEDIQASVVYTCMEKNTWSPAFPALVCKETPEEWGKDKLFLLLLLLIFIPVSIVICKWRRQSACDKVSKRCCSFSCRRNSKKGKNGKDAPASILKDSRKSTSSKPASPIDESSKQLLLQTENCRDGDAWTKFQSACDRGDTKTVKSMLEEDRKCIHLRDKSGLTLLMYASKMGKTEIVRVLFAYGASVTDTFNKMWTSLHFACQYGHKDVAEVLIKEHADVNLVTVDGLTPLHFACQYGHKDVAEVLIKERADVNLVTVDGLTPLHLACQGGHKDVVNLLVEADAIVNSVSDDKSTPLDPVG